MLEGSVRKTDNRIRITTQLIDIADGCHLWTEQYDRELEDVFAIQEEIAHRQYLEKGSDFDLIRENPSDKALIEDLTAREKASGLT